MNGEGGEVGPDLTGVARNDTASLLASIVDPGAVIRLPYLQYAAVTTGGRVVTGIVVSQDEAGVVFVDAEGDSFPASTQRDRGASSAADLDHARRPLEESQAPRSA